MAMASVADDEIEKVIGRTVPEFYAEHCAAGGLVIAFCDDGTTGLFSTLDKATAWADLCLAMDLLEGRAG